MQADCGVKVAGTRKPNNPAKFILIRTLINKDCFFVFFDQINPNKKSLLIGGICF
jgi:hypothetical protein